MVSIVMPAYNESDIIATVVREWHAEVIARLPSSELIVVDDCSTDGTGPVLLMLAAELPSLRVVRSERNSGHGPAVRLGIQRATREFVFHTDSDRQHLAGEFWNLWAARAGCDFVFGVRRRRQDGAWRTFVSTFMRLLNFLIWGLWIADANCPFRLMRAEALRTVLRRIPRDSFIPMVMVSILARKLGMTVCEVSVTHLPRTGGQQSLKGTLTWLRVGYVCARQLVRLRLSA